MARKLFLSVALATTLLPAFSQTAKFSSFTYEGRDSRFDKNIDVKSQYLNPIVSGFYPDPTVLRVGDTYWLANSTFGYFPGVPLFKSVDLVNWHQVGNVLDRPSQLNLIGSDVSGGVFAPHLSYNPKNKTYYMTTMSNGRVFYVKSKNPEKGWSDPIFMKYGGMDTSFFFDNDGKAWVAYCAKPFDKNLPGGQMAIHLNEFDWRGDSIKAKTWELTTGSGAMKSPRWTEGPHIYKVGKYYYLMCAEGGTELLHSEVIFRSKNITGPYEDYSGNPILTQRDLPDTGRADVVSSTGHADLVQAKDGKWWAVFLGCRPYEHELYNTGRETFLLPVTWKDGWPVILPKGEAVPTVVNKPGLKPEGVNMNTGNIHYTENFTSTNFGPQWIFLRNPDMTDYKLGDGLIITPTSATLSGKDSPSCAFFRQKNTSFTAETELTFNPVDSAVAGIVAFQSDKNHVVLGKSLINGKPSITLTMTDNGIDKVIGTVALKSSDANSPVKLRIDGDGRYYSFLYNVGNEGWKALAQGVDCQNLSKTYSGGFVGTTIGLYASINKKSTQTYTHNPLFVNFPSPYYDKKGVGHFYSADPSARVWKINGRDVLYVYCSHDLEPPRGCDRMDRYHVFSTEDLKNWTDHGEIINAAQVNHQFAKEFPYAEGKDDVQFMWAPDCMHNSKDNTYYYYFPKAVAWQGKNGAPETEWKIFVAQSKDPATGFKVTGYLKDAVSYIDPNVFLDDDGTLYFYQGGGAHLFGGKFRKDDWTQLDGTPVEMKIAGKNSDFHEGAWVFKKDGKYYLTYPDNHSPQLGGNRMRYATSDSPLGPWTEQGIYMFPHGEETAHGSVVKFKGKWYQFYHTGNYSGRGNLRSVCVDELTFNDKGEINLVKNWGTPRFGKPFSLGDKTVTIQAEDYNNGGSHYGFFLRQDNNHGVLQTLQEGGTKYISYLDKKEWTRYSINAKQGNYKVTIRLRKRNNAPSSIILAVDGSWIKTLPLADKVNEWQEVTADNIQLTEANQYLELRCGDGNLEIDWIKVSKQ